MSGNNLPIVIVFGGSGPTGSSIVNALLERNEFQVKIPVRPSSVDKPITINLRDKGAIIVPFDFTDPSVSVDDVQEVIAGADTVICAITYTQLEHQRKLVDAAKKVGTKRFVPCDFGTSGQRGRRRLHDLKLDIRDYVKASGIGYTFIDVGFWYQLLVICTDRKQAPPDYPWVYEASRHFFNSGTVKTASTDVGDVGRFTARIIADPRTLNRYVYAWGEELTQQDLLNYARKYGDSNTEIIHKSTTDLEFLVAEAKEKELEIVLVYREYQYSMWVLGENTVEMAKRPEFGGALDARELYPDMKLRPFEDFVKEFYNGGK